MKLRAACCAGLILALLGCGNSARNFAYAPDAGAGTGGSAGAHEQGPGGRNGASGNGGGGGRSDEIGSGGQAGESDSAGMGGSGSEEGGDAGMAGMVDMPTDPCLGKVCNTPPASDCQSPTAFQTYDQMGSCAAGICSYTSHQIACTCQAHTCTTDPCIGVTCSTPLVPVCKDPNTLTTYTSGGAMCNVGSCNYPSANTTCAFGCANGACKADPCATVTCNKPPSAACKDALTQTTYASTGTCAAGNCSYTATDSGCGSNRRCTGTACAVCASDASCGASCTACSGGTPKCKNLGTTSQCVACASNADCSNGGTCDGTGRCACSARFNGIHCEFQAFRGIGVLAGDAGSYVNNISRDGTVVLGRSQTASYFSHAVRSINGGALQFISPPPGLTTTNGCEAWAADAMGSVLGVCDGATSFLYNSSGYTPINISPYSGFARDISLDGKVIVGVAFGTFPTPDQAFRRTNSSTMLLGLLEPDGFINFTAVNGDGSVVVGLDDSNEYAGWFWSLKTGIITRLSTLPGFGNYQATDVSTDGNVIVGWTANGADGSKAVKWSGAAFSPTEVGPGTCQATNQDGSVLVGDNGVTAAVWTSSGANTVTGLLGSTPDLTGWTLTSASGVSDDGKVVVGTGTHAGQAEGWVAHLP